VTTWNLLVPYPENTITDVLNVVAKLTCYMRMFVILLHTVRAVSEVIGNNNTVYVIDFVVMYFRRN